MWRYGITKKSKLTYFDNTKSHGIVQVDKYFVTNILSA